jgi:hypothetical protein
VTEPTWWELLDLDWEVELILLDEDEWGGEHGEGQP